MMENQVILSKSVSRVLPTAYFLMQPAAEINRAMVHLPVADEMDLMAVSREKDNPFEIDVPNFKTIKVTDAQGREKFVNCPTISYKLVQHRDAFRPIIEGLTQAGVSDFRFLMKSDWGKAKMEIYATQPGYDTVSLGFHISNSVDGTSAIDFGLKVSREMRTVEIVGYRQVCSNGMKIRVPLEEAEIVRPEVRIKIQELLSQHKKIRHTASAEEHLQRIQYTVEAIALLRNPVEEIIKRAQQWKISDEAQLRFLIHKHVGKRLMNRVVQQFEDEPEQSLWDLYNAITYVASHDHNMSLSRRERLTDKAAGLLEGELFFQ